MSVHLLRSPPRPSLLTFSGLRVQPPLYPLPCQPFPFNSQEHSREPAPWAAVAMARAGTWHVSFSEEGSFQLQGNRFWNNWGRCRVVSGHFRSLSPSHAHTRRTRFADLGLAAPHPRCPYIPEAAQRHLTPWGRGASLQARPSEDTKRAFLEFFPKPETDSAPTFLVNVTSRCVGFLG